MNPMYYVQVIFGGIEPTLHGPYTTTEERDAAAKQLHADTDPDTDSVLALDLTPADATVGVESWAYSAAFFTDED